MDFETKDSGKRQNFKSGAVRDTEENKRRWDLIPVYPMKRLSDLYTRGATKYDAKNWQKGIKSTRFWSSANRHLKQFEVGFRYNDKELRKQGYSEDEIDTIRKEDHLAAVVFNLCGIIYNQGVRTEYNDLEREKVELGIESKEKNNKLKNSISKLKKEVNKLKDILT